MKKKNLFYYIVIVSFILLMVQRGFNYVTHINRGNKKDTVVVYPKKESSNQDKGDAKTEIKPEKDEAISKSLSDTTKVIEVKTDTVKSKPEAEPKAIVKAKKIVEKVKSYYEVVTRKCTGCGLCRKNCPTLAITQNGPPTSKGLKTVCDR